LIAGCLGHCANTLVDSAGLCFVVENVGERRRFGRYYCGRLVAVAVGIVVSLLLLLLVLVVVAVMAVVAVVIELS
jgi:hypothetical protein